MMRPGGGEGQSFGACACFLLLKDNRGAKIIVDFDHRDHVGRRYIVRSFEIAGRMTMKSVWSITILLVISAVDVLSFSGMVY